MKLLSIIIPLSPYETELQNLLDDLANLPEDIEVFFVTSEKSTIFHKTILLKRKYIRLVTNKSGRAEQMNAGAEAASGKYLWFLHADSKFGHDTFTMLLSTIKKHPRSLLYFDLTFFNDFSCLMCINELGVLFRTRILKIPFGDQGFCIKKTLFQKIGGFTQNLPYGEDHIFVWKARQHGIEIQAIYATLYTSARKYKKHGWFKTTLIHQYLWLKQAWPEWKKLKKK